MPRTNLRIQCSQADDGAESFPEDHIEMETCSNNSGDDAIIEIKPS